MSEVVPLEIPPEEVKRRLDRGERVVLLDVRQPEEHAICRIDGAKLIPMNEVPNHLAELDPDEEIVVHCKMGGRASQVAAYLRQQGFSKARNLTGGILAWAERIDPGMPKY